MIAPIWTKIRVGPILRGERDTRQYQRLFSSGGRIAGARRLVLLGTGRRVDEKSWRLSAGRGRRPVIVCFRSMLGAEALAGRHREVGEELIRITRPAFLPTHLPASPFIGVHVRLGDFRSATELELRSGAHCRRTPVRWYVDTLLALRRALGHEMEAKILSDGEADELAPLLALPRTSRYEGGSAITDMLALSRAAALIASGSAFSMWGGYLGDVPTVWFPGQNFSMRRPGNARDAEWDHSRTFPQEFLNEISV